MVSGISQEGFIGMLSMPLQSLLLRGTLNTGCDCQLATLGSFVLEFAFHEPCLMGEWRMSKTWSHSSGVAPWLTLPPSHDGASASVPVLDSQIACLAFLTYPHPAAISWHPMPKARLAGSCVPDTGTWCIGSHHALSTTPGFDRQKGDFWLHFLAWHGHH